MRLNPWSGILAALAVIVATLLAASGVAAAGNTLRITPPSSTPTVGGTFSVSVVANASVAISGASATVAFDRTRLQVTALAKAGPWATDGASYIGFPSTANTAAALAQYNAAGKVGGYPTGSIAVSFVDGSSSEPATTDIPLFSVTFKVLACGSSSLDLAVGGSDGGMLNGTAVGYGNSLDVTSTSSTVTTTCATPTSTSTTPNPTAVQTTAPTQVVAGQTYTPTITLPPTDQLPGQPASTSFSIAVMVIGATIFSAGAVLAIRGARRGRNRRR